jgi:hypothetical protein
VTLGMVVESHQSHRFDLQAYVIAEVGAAVVLGGCALYLWYRAAAATRDPSSRSGGHAL